MTVPVAEPVPSVLPAEGIDLKRELDRYRDWILEQALIRTRNNIAHAAEFVGWSVTSMHSWLKRKGIDLPPGPKGPHARRLAASQDARTPDAGAARRPRESEEASAAAPSDTAAERLLAKVAARLDWARVAELRDEGLSDTRVAQRLAWEMGNAHRWTIEKILRRQREQEAR